MKNIADAATSHEGLEIKDIQIRIPINPEGQTTIPINRPINFLLTYDNSKIAGLGLTWTYFKETFTNITAAKEILSETELTKWTEWNLNFTKMTLYSQFYIFLILFLRFR